MPGVAVNSRTCALIGVLIAAICTPARADQDIYTDALQNGWQDWSWATVNLNHATTVHSGSKSISVDAGAFQALYLQHAAQDADNFTDLTFWIHGGASGGQLIQVEGLLSGAGQPGVNLSPLTAGAWQQVTVSMASLGIAGQTSFDGIWIRDRSGATQPTFFVDDISLIGGTPPPVTNPPPSGAVTQLPYVGVNLSVAEFGEGNLPGTFNTHYRYPTLDEVDYFRSKCMNTVRMCFRWERLQQSTNAAFDATELSRMDTFVNGATAKGVTVILDPHNYARYYPDSPGGGLIGTDPAVPYSAFGDFWSRLADHYKSNPRVIFGLMNEPHDMVTENWVTAANTAIAAIRATGAANLILVPGNGWTGAHSWMQNWYGTANGVAMLNIVDSGSNIAFEAHQYLDGNSSGTSDTIVSETIGAERMQPFTTWLIANNKKGFLGEFAVANSTIGAGIGDEALNNMLQHIEDNADVYLGWSWWAAGPWWNEYRFTLEPTNIGQPSQADRPTMGILRNRIGPVPAAVNQISPTQYQFEGLIDYVYQPQIATDLALSNWTDNGSTVLGTGGTSSVPISTAADAAYHRVCATCPDQ